MRIPYGARGVVALVLAAMLPLPRVARAAPSEGASATAPSEDPALVEAQALYRRGVSAYEVFDYAEAIRLWTDAYHGLSQVDGSERIRLGLVYNIATARQKAYAIDKDAAQLRQAKLLLEAYLTGIGAVRGDDGWTIPPESQSDALRDDTMRVEATLREIEATLAETGPKPVDPASSAAPKQRRRGVGLVAAGASIGVVGLGMLGMMGAGLAKGARVQDRLDDPTVPASELQSASADGRRANTIAIAGGVLAGVLVATGVVLAVLGAKRMRERGSAGSSASLRGVLGVRWNGVGSL